MQKTVKGTSCVLFPSMKFLNGAGYTLDIGNTFNDTNLIAPSHIIDCASIANDWRVVGDELRKAMRSFSRNKS